MAKSIHRDDSVAGAEPSHPRLNTKNDGPGKILAWLQKSPGLPELAARFPADWERVQGEAADIVARGTPEDLKAITDGRGIRQPHPQGSAGGPGRDARLSAHIRHRMACLLIKQSWSVAVSNSPPETGPTTRRKPRSRSKKIDNSVSSCCRPN